MRRLRTFVTTPFAPRSLTALLYTLLVLPLAVAGALLVVTGLLLGGLLSVTPLGPWLIALTVRGALSLGILQRALAQALLGMAIEPPVLRSEPGVFGWRRAALGARAGWRAVGCALAAPLTAALPVAAVTIGYVYGLLLALHPVLKHWNYVTVRAADGSVRHVSLQVMGVEFDSWPRWVVAVAAGLLLLLAAPWLLRHALAPHRALLSSLLGPGAADQRIRTLEETRAQAVDDAAAVLRRIERDLHDGAQARLVGLGMHLTLIHELIAADADRDRLLAVVHTAQGNAKQAVVDLRNLVRGIHPPVLDQGLDAALATLAADSALPVTLTADIPVRPTPAIESIAYFCAAELLANAVKHSSASEVSIDVAAGSGAAAGALRLAVRDDGRGGAVLGAGSGLTGLLARVRTVDGILTCDSPSGGPTVVTVLLPAR
ncbi:sensor domain-containing protein [Streptomyces sp. NBC_00006]|uniref:sensor histidine kinase n=1 Tax=unclassified Streptomyces TaxID=2593676 RepID=UPI002256DCFE|nr:MULTISPECIES: sensor domain-containing protein [unclassified Streptomyces]MCX4827936.1 sensor domain-containing protein [Streptomyces sp. NBC_01016]MCX5532709.1 sensor domain-containing protein [Streptomyces sp. NBC_00006]